MALPGFTAEASIGPTSQTYRVLHQYWMAGTEYLSPQGMDDDTELDDSEIDEGKTEDDGEAAMVWECRAGCWESKVPLSRKERRWDDELRSQPGRNPPEGVSRRQPRRVNLPGFISEDVGLGDVLKQVTSSVGIRPCGGCL